LHACTAAVALHSPFEVAINQRGIEWYAGRHPLDNDGEGLPV
jgi:hypothetical protein